MKNNVKKRSKAPIIGDMIFSLLTLPAGLTYISSELGGNVEETELRILLTFTFLLLSFSRLLRARRCRLGGRPKSVCVMQLVYGGVYFICALLPLFMGLVHAAFYEEIRCPSMPMDTSPFSLPSGGAPTAPIQPKKDPAPTPEPKPTSFFCPNCGTKMPVGTAFCPNCGTKL